MRIALADDGVLFREGLRRLLEELGQTVVSECSTGEELFAALDTGLTTDAVVVDIRMPPTHTDEGIVTAGEIRRRYPDVGVLVLSTYSESAYATALLASGSSHLGYLLKDRVDDAATLVDALERVTAGGSVLDPEVVAGLVASNQNGRILQRLSAREREVLALMAEGRSNAGIGQVLFLSPRTVEAHVAAIFTKLDITPEPDLNRRVRAVLTWLEMTG